MQTLAAARRRVRHLSIVVERGADIEISLSRICSELSSTVIGFDGLCIAMEFQQRIALANKDLCQVCFPGCVELALRGLLLLSGCDARL